MDFYTAQKMNFSIKDFFSKCDQIRRKLPIDLVTFTEEIINRKLHFCTVLLVTKKIILVNVTRQIHEGEYSNWLHKTRRFKQEGDTTESL